VGVETERIAAPRRRRTPSPLTICRRRFRPVEHRANNINTCPNSLRVLKNSRWTPVELEANQKEVLAKILHHYGIDKRADGLPENT